jgi:acetoin utilization protein AcuB
MQKLPPACATSPDLRDLGHGMCAASETVTTPMQATDIMISRVVSVRPTDTVASALEVLSELDVRHVPVVDAGELVGMISDRDLRSLGVYQLRDLESLDRVKALARLPVSEVMTSDVKSVDPSTDVRDVIELMINEKISAVPVVDPHTTSLLGIISYVDVLRAAGPLFAEP